MQSHQTPGRSRQTSHLVRADVAKPSGRLVCLVFVGVLACAFWAGALLASHPLLH
jgi:hypothetical protein